MHYHPHSYSEESSGLGLIEDALMRLDRFSRRRQAKRNLSTVHTMQVLHPQNSTKYRLSEQKYSELKNLPLLTNGRPNMITEHTEEPYLNVPTALAGDLGCQFATKNLVHPIRIAFLVPSSFFLNRQKDYSRRESHSYI